MPRMQNLFFLLLIAGIACSAQQVKTTAGPATDTSVQASPLQPAPRAAAVDAATQASPVSPIPSPGAGLAPHTALSVKLNTAIDSGTLKNGQNIAATLTQEVRANGIMLPAGTPAEISVINTLPAGRMQAEGEFSLQLVRVGKVDVFTDIQTFRGKPGAQDLPDSAPKTGTDAGLARNAALTFHTQPNPEPASKPPANAANPPGSIDGVAAGGTPPAGATPGAATIQQIDKSAVNPLATQPKQ